MAARTALPVATLEVAANQLERGALAPYQKNETSSSNSSVRRARLQQRQMGLKPQYNIGECPLPIVEQVTGNVLGNFFETTIVEYSKNSLTGEWVY